MLQLFYLAGKKQRKLAQREPRTYQEVRLLAKAGIPLESDDKDSDIEEVPREDPQDALKRQMKERKRLEEETTTESTEPTSMVSF